MFTKLFIAFLALATPLLADLPLFYWVEKDFVNFGDYLSKEIVERMVQNPIRIYKKGVKEKKLLAVGSILTFARDNDVIWGSGINGKFLNKKHYPFKTLDIRSVRGPKTQEFLQEELGVKAPSIFGDPALLMPRLFPEFKKSETPKYPFIVILHYLDVWAYSKTSGNVVYATDPWDEVVKKILDSEFVISSSLHGLIVAEAYGIPAKLLRVSEKEPLFKFEDYYQGTGRKTFSFATSIDDALYQGGEPLPEIDLDKIYRSFPFELYKPS